MYSCDYYSPHGESSTCSLVPERESRDIFNYYVIRFQWRRAGWETSLEAGNSAISWIRMHTAAAREHGLAEAAGQAYAEPGESGVPPCLRVPGTARNRPGGADSINLAT